MIRIALSCSLDGVSEGCPEEAGRCQVNNSYIYSVLRAGAAPVLFPVIQDTEALSSMIDSCSGLILTGGDDVSPLLYGEEPLPEVQLVSDSRDRHEFLLFRLAVERKIPVFGICRGMQLINVALGGSLHQHLGVIPEFKHEHRQEESRYITTHSVTIEKGSIMERVLGSEAQVNSFHHQAIKVLAPGLKVTATSPDGVIEAVESTDPLAPAIIGVQWHPEGLSKTKPEMAELFKFFVEMCQEATQA